MKRNVTSNHRSALRAFMLFAFTAMFSFVPVLDSSPSMADVSNSASTGYVVVIQSNH